ncbi:MAG: hypothetical protein HZT40_07580 [Candidatus Thiothrix singaporensis]|uniref:Uncharacterized protein n=1 Tax=Candidatus Thiothrix singaporensis TaxID=2799669 RepID=A0A7L6AQW0_9GAMM|nr:MAG: hypothetical protein HZT40_07580 [Candidatus Thiothrix singaporensis]
MPDLNTEKRNWCAALMRGKAVPRSPCQPKGYRALMRVNSVPTSNADFKTWVRRADAREMACRVRRANPKVIMR